MSDSLTSVLFWFPVVLLVYHWALYPLLLALAARRRRRQPAQVGDGVLPSVSIVMAAYNEEALIGEKLRESATLDYPAGQVEVLVGSDASTDATDDIVSRFGDSRVRLIRYEPRSGKIPVQNRLLGEAKGDLVLLTDVDASLTNDSLRLMVERLRDLRVGVVSPNYRRLNNEGSAAESVYDRWESKVKELEGRLGAMVGCYGWALLLRRELAGPIPDDTILDDFVIGIRPFRRGFDAVTEPSAMVVTRTESEGLEFWRKVRINRGNLQALLRFSDLLAPRYGVKAWVYWSHKVLRMGVPFLLAAMLVVSGLRVGSPFFEVAFVVQATALLTVPLLFIARGRWRRLLFPQYYYLMNIAVLVGYWQFLVRRDRYWRRTPRQ